MPLSKLEISTFLMRAMGWYTVALSILWIFVTEIMFVSDFHAYTGQAFADYLSSNPRFAELYIITKKMIGMMLLGIGLLVFFITERSFKKGEKWAWYALLVAGTITWGTFIGYKILISYIGVSMITFALGAALYLVAIILSAREILGKQSS